MKLDIIEQSTKPHAQCFRHLANLQSLGTGSCNKKKRSRVKAFITWRIWRILIWKPAIKQPNDEITVIGYAWLRSRNHHGLCLSTFDEVTHFEYGRVHPRNNHWRPLSTWRIYSFWICLLTIKHLQLMMPFNIWGIFRLYVLPMHFDTWLVWIPQSCRGVGSTWWLMMMQSFGIHECHNAGDVAACWVSLNACQMAIRRITVFYIIVRFISHANIVFLGCHNPV